MSYVSPASNGRMDSRGEHEDSKNTKGNRWSMGLCLVSFVTLWSNGFSAPRLWRVAMGRISTEEPGPWFCVLLVWASVLTLSLISFSCSRLFVLDDPRWPRPFPYPDQLLYALERKYDAVFPVEPGYIKLHGEFDRVRWTLWWAAVPPHLIALASAGMLCTRLREQVRPHSQRLWLSLWISFGVLCTAWMFQSSTLIQFGAQILVGIAAGMVLWLLFVFLPALDRWRLERGWEAPLSNED